MAPTPTRARRLLHALSIALPVVAIGAVAWSVARRPAAEGAAGAGSPPPCPRGFVDRPGLAARLEARLRALPEGPALLRAVPAGSARWCFGAIDPSVVTVERVLLLDASLPEEEAAARAGHLLSHLRDGLPLPATIERGADCDALTRTALRREARAHVLEAELREALGLPPDRYGFEPALRAASGRRRREEVVHAYLVAHPEGGPHLDGLARSYAARCARESR